MLADSGLRSALAWICETNDRGTCVHRSHVASSGEFTGGADQVGETEDVPARPRRSARMAPVCVRSSDSHGYSQENNGVFDRFERVSGVGDDDQITG